MNLDKNHENAAPRVIHADWLCHKKITAFVTTRSGGFSAPPFGQLNLGDHVGDQPETVKKNRNWLKKSLLLPAEPLWLNQIHSNLAIDAAGVSAPISADAAYTNQTNIICTVMTADCLPVFFAAKNGSEVAVAHAGWRGLADGILEETAKNLQTDARHIQCWLGPAIGPQAFEVGSEVREVFLSQNKQTSSAFKSVEKNRWLANIYALAKSRLNTIGITDISGGHFCTFQDDKNFYSYRREKTTGRMASLIWIND